MGEIKIYFSSIFDYIVTIQAYGLGKMKVIKLLLIVALVGISPMCGSNLVQLLEGVNGFDDITTIGVVSTSPSPGEGSVPVSSAVMVTLSDTIDDATLSGNFIVQNSGIPVSGTIVFDHVTKTIIFDPDVSLSMGTVYTVILTRNISNVAGEGMIADYSYSFSTVAAMEPEFDLLQGITPLEKDDTYDFGTITVGDPPLDIIFTIDNPGAAPLNLTGVPRVQVAGADFSILVQPGHQVAAGGNTTFTVRFTPPAAGEKTEVITIPNNDSTEDPYTLTVIGTVLASGIAPEINVKRGHRNFPTGREYDFGTVRKDHSSVPVTFTIKNLGNANLTITSIVLGGPDSGVFSLGGLPGLPTDVVPGASQSFTATFSPTAKGKRTAEIQISNNDSNENPYILKLKGRGK